MRCHLQSLDVVTKRTILKYSSQIYDPLGLLSPITVSAKILLQELWKDKYDWDTPLPDPVLETWNQLARSLNRDTEVKFTRQLFPSANSDSETSLHIFVDASVKSYGAVAYTCDQFQARLVMAKNRVEPLTPSNLLYGRKMTSIPYHQHYTDDEITFIQSEQTTLTNRSRTQASIISEFWKRWRSEYLTALREYHKTTGLSEERIRVGDVVQIYDEGPRIRWKLAVI